MLTPINPTRHHANSLETAPRQTTANPGDPAGFASLLRQRQAAPAPPTASPPLAKVTADAQAPANQTHNGAQSTPPSTSDPAAAPAEGDGDGDATPHPTPTTPRQRTALKLRHGETDGRAAVREATPARGNHALPATEGAADEAEAANARASVDPSASPGNLPHANPPLEPCVMHWFAGQQRASDAAEADAATATASSAAAGEAAEITPTDTPNRASRTAGLGPNLDLDPKDKPVHARGLADDMAASARAFSSASAQPVMDETKTQLAVHAAAPAIPTATSAAFAAIASPTNAVDTATAATAATIVAPMTSPDFAQELGLTLGVFARAGVQHAELHLNPTEMGPVSVQIAIDGNQARIDFGADLAATRHAIEQGLPALASALTDAGFTLAGGGVSQHAGQSQSGPSSGERGGRGLVEPDARFRKISSDGLASVASAARRAAASGGVDVFA